MSKYIKKKTVELLVSFEDICRKHYHLNLDHRHDIYIQPKSDNITIYIEGEFLLDFNVTIENNNLVVSLYRPDFDGSLMLFTYEEIIPKDKEYDNIIITLYDAVLP